VRGSRTAQIAITIGNHRKPMQGSAIAWFAAKVRE